MAATVRAYAKQRVNVYQFMRPDFARILKARNGVRPSRIGAKAATAAAMPQDAAPIPSHDQLVAMFRRTGWPIIDARKKH